MTKKQTANWVKTNIAVDEFEGALDSFFAKHPCPLRDQMDEQECPYCKLITGTYSLVHDFKSNSPV